MSARFPSHRVFAVSFIGLLVVSASAAAPTPQWVRSPSTGRVQMIKFDVAPRVPGVPMASLVRPTPESAAAASGAFVGMHREWIPLTDPGSELSAPAVVPDELGYTHVRYTQVHRGLPVYGAELGVHIDPAGQVYLVDLKLADGLPPSIQPTRSAAEAIAIALRKGSDDARAEISASQQPPALSHATSAVAADRNGTTADDLPAAGPGILAPPMPADVPLPFVLEPVGEPRLVVIPLSLLANEPGSRTVLAWEVEVGDAPSRTRIDRRYFVDASTGEVVYALSDIRALNRQVSDCAAAPGDWTCRLDYASPLYPGYVFGRSEASPPRGPSPNTGTFDFVTRGINYSYSYLANTQADAAYSIAGSVHSLVASRFGLNGANNHGGTATYPNPLDPTPIYTNEDQGGGFTCPGASAVFFTSGGRIAFCQGQVVPDILGHEYGHALLQHLDRFKIGDWSEGPVYDGQSGSLQEAFCDFFGEVLEDSLTGSATWRMGTNAFNWYTGLNDGEARWLDLPATCPWAPPDQYSYACGSNTCYYPYPSRYSSTARTCPNLVDYGDNHGVHRNSTIASHAFYLLAAGGPTSSNSGCDIEPIGPAATLQLFWRAWKVYFASTENFYPQGYNHIVQAATDLFPTNVVDQVRRALQAVQMDVDGCAAGAVDSGFTCSVRHVTNAGLYKPRVGTGALVPSTIFAPGEIVTVKGCGNMPNKVVRLSIIPKSFTFNDAWNGPITINSNSWANTLYTEYGYTDGDGCFSMTFRNPVAQYTSGSTTYTNYYLIVDGGDGVYERKSDLYFVIKIQPPVAGDGICQVGQFPSTHEDCHSVPADCSCLSDTCVPVEGDPTGTWACSASLVATDGMERPRVTALHANRPNPFRASTTITYDLASSGPVEIGVYDLQGRQVRQLIEGWRPVGGAQSIRWDGLGDDGRQLPAGVYLCRLRSGVGAVSSGVRKLMLVR